jgi:5-methylcytosine-specific restriction endonuclease McrA
MALSFNSRTYTMYTTIKARGPVEFSLAEFREHLESSIERSPRCPYCQVLLMLKNVSADHMTPVSRGGSNHLSNIQFLCKADNKAKGSMSDAEYGRLLELLDQMEREFPASKARSRVRTALIISSSFRFGTDRRNKKAQTG